MKAYSDISSLAVIGITLALFGVALFTKGLCHDLLLEAGVFLVSVKLIIMMRRNKIDADEIKSRLDRIAEDLKKDRANPQ